MSAKILPRGRYSNQQAAPRVAAKIIENAASRQVGKTFDQLRATGWKTAEEKLAEAVRKDDEAFFKRYKIADKIERDNPYGVLTVGFKKYPVLAQNINRVLEKFAQAGMDMSHIIPVPNEEVSLCRAIHIASCFTPGCDGYKLARRGELGVVRSLILFNVDKLNRKSWTQDFTNWGKQLTHLKLRKIKDALRQTSEFSSGHPWHPIIHEFVHAFHKKNLAQIHGAELINRFSALKLPAAFWDHVRKQVGTYAAQERFPEEVIAEMGTAILTGRKLKLTPDVQKFWNDWWRGPELPFGLFAQK